MLFKILLLCSLLSTIGLKNQNMGHLNIIHNLKIIQTWKQKLQNATKRKLLKFKLLWFLDNSATKTVTKLNESS